MQNISTFTLLENDVDQLATAKHWRFSAFFDLIS